jgi:hypothetical protein
VQAQDRYAGKTPALSLVAGVQDRIAGGEARIRRLRLAVYAAAVRSYSVFSMRRSIWRIQRHLNNEKKVPVSHAAARRFWKKHFGINICTRWHDVYAQTSGLDDPRYVPEDVFYGSILPVLNHRELIRAYADKNLYCRWLPEELLPHALLRCIHGRFYSHDFVQIEPVGALPEGEEFFIKPSLDSGGGRQVEILSIRGGVPHLWEIATTWAELRAQYHDNFIVQRRLVQHPAISALNESSINTLRVMTLRMEQPWVVATAIRIGRAGSHVDNKTAGRAVICGVLPDGRLQAWATDKGENRVPNHPDGGYRFGGQEVPGIQAAWELARDLHHRLPYFDLVSWDITIDPDCKPHLVEANLRAPEINFHQLSTGPIFGDRTEEVLGFVRRRRDA